MTIKRMDGVSTTSTTAEAFSGALGIGFFILIICTTLLALSFQLFIGYKIAKKAGFSGWWTLSQLVPILSSVIVILFAFVEWPIEKKMKGA